MRGPDARERREIMDLRQLEVFAGVYELRSFSRAASALRLTQSTVSEHVRLLEEELGTRLFDRLSRETVPTRAGELLYGYARQMLALRTEARQALDQFLGQVTGTLLVGASTIPGEYVLPAVIGRFRARHPRVSITLQISDSRGIAQAVLDGQVDVGVVGADPGNRVLEARALMPDELVLVVPPGHRWVGRREVMLEELRAEPLIVREPGSGSRQALERALEAAGRSLGDMQVIAEMGSTSAIKQAVKAGVGVSVMSRRAAEDECRHGLLACVKLKDLSVTRQFYVVTHAGRSRPALPCVPGVPRQRGPDRERIAARPDAQPGSDAIQASASRRGTSRLAGRRLAASLPRVTRSSPRVAVAGCAGSGRGCSSRR